MAADGVGGTPAWADRVRIPGPEVWVPEGFGEWGRRDREGYLAQRSVFVAEGTVLGFVHDCVERARASGAVDPEETAAAEVGTSMAVTAGRAAGLVGAAVELFGRLPRVAALLRGGWIGLEAVRAVVEQTRLVSDEVIGELDRLLAERLGPTRRRSHAPKIGPLKRMLGRMIRRADPVAAEATARRARADTDVRLDPASGDRAVLSATLPAEQGVEVMERIEQMARRAAEDDRRTLPQKRAAALLALTRGWDVLPDGDGHRPGDPGAAGAVRQVVLYAFEPAESGAPVELRGYGPVTRVTAEAMEAGVRRRFERVADLADRRRDGALRYTPSTPLRAFCQGRDGTCVFPGCQVEAERCDLDHTIPFDHEHPERGGRTTSDEMAPLCRGHHRMKTAGIWAYYRDGDGTYVWLHGPAHPDPDRGTRIRVEPTGPLAAMARPVDPGTVARQRTAAEAGRTGGGGFVGPARDGRRERREAEVRRRRARAEQCLADAERSRSVEPRAAEAQDDAPPF